MEVVNSVKTKEAGILSLTLEKCKRRSVTRRLLSISLNMESSTQFCNSRVKTTMQDTWETSNFTITESLWLKCQMKVQMTTIKILQKELCCCLKTQVTLKRWASRTALVMFSINLRLQTAPLETTNLLLTTWLLHYMINQETATCLLSWCRESPRYRMEESMHTDQIQEEVSMLNTLKVR